MPFPPEVPRGVQIIVENGVYVMRTLEPTPKSLYTYDKDEPNKSNCTGSCATAWVPLKAPAEATRFEQWTAIRRADGSKQWAFQGKPVYTYHGDDGSVAKGDGVGGVWHLLPTTPR